MGKDTDQTNSLWTYCPIDEPEPEIQVLPPAPGFTLISEESRGICTSCPHLGGGAVSGGLEGCKKLCRDTTNCNAFNYKNNVCYTKQCAADCDIKPYTTHGGWNVYMDTKLNCADKQEPEVDDRKTGGDCLTDGLIYLSKDSTDIVAELRGVASALECQNLCRKQTTCDYGTSAVSGFCTPKEGLCTHLYYSSTETHCMMFQSHPTEVDMSMMPKGWYLAGTVYC